MSSAKDFADQVPVFHGSGWITWEPIMKAFLRTKGVWKYIDGSATVPTLGVIMDLDEAPEPPTVQEPIEPGPKAPEGSNLAYDAELAAYKLAWKEHRAAMATWRAENYEARSYNHKTQAEYIKAKADFDEGNDKALGYLSIKISRSLYHLLTESASESWTILKDQYSKTGAAQLYLDWIKLKEFYMSSSKPPADQISHLRSLLDRLSPHVVLPESLKTLILLGSLPADWRQSFQTLLLTLDPAELKMQDCITRINEEYTRRLSTGEARPSRAPAPAAAVAGQPRFQQNPPPTHWQGRGGNQSRGRGGRGRGRGRGGAAAPYWVPTQPQVHHQPQVIPAPQTSAPPAPAGHPGVNKHGIERKGPNTQKLPPGQKGPNYARNLQKKYQRKAAAAIRAATATGEYTGAPQAQYVDQDWQIGIIVGNPWVPDLKPTPIPTKYPYPPLWVW
ncbi:hypothetical protein M378DRAFT_18243, partial [Amanita muscaria Koide BX008]